MFQTNDRASKSFSSRKIHETYKKKKLRSSLFIDLAKLFCCSIRLFVNSWGKSELKQKRRMEQAMAKKLSLVQR